MKDSSVLTTLNFHPTSKRNGPTAPVSLLSRIDYTEYEYFRAGKGLVAISSALDRLENHNIRIIAVDSSGEGHIGMAFEGIWLSNGGSLVASQRKRISDSPGTGAAPSLPTNESIRYSRQGLQTEEAQKIKNSGPNRSGFQQSLFSPQKTLEIVTDTPITSLGRTTNRTEPAIMGWEALIGDMFGVDHVRTSVNGMCVTSPCIGGAAQPANVKDAFFRRCGFEASGFKGCR